MELASAVISERAKKRLKGKHPWIFSNELDVRPAAAPGDPVRVLDHSGNFIAEGYYNPHTLIAVRILNYHHSFDLADRIRRALEWRSRHYTHPVYRWIYGESDGLPGLIVDRYAETLVAQILTAGMERMREAVLERLREMANPARILLRNDSPYRKLEGLPMRVEWVYGEPLEQQTIEVDGLRLVAPLVSGQKTGFFLDQQENRRRLLRYAHGEAMLDAFCYTGSWSMYGAKASLQSITAVDTSSEALEIARQTAKLNGINITTVEENVVDFLRAQYATKDRYDVIVLDPPAFCKSKKQLAQAVRGYREINVRAMKLLQKNGVLFTCSCSQPIDPEIFEDILRQAAQDSGRTFVLREMLFHPPDHPVLLHFPESHYLKCAILQLQ
jgi:23S rRNA (cytosine1962-C5)-methyltransferase